MGVETVAVAMESFCFGNMRLCTSSLSKKSLTFEALLLLNFVLSDCSLFCDLKNNHFMVVGMETELRKDYT